VPWTVILETSVIGGHGTITPTTGQQEVNAVVDLMATPDFGFQVMAWTGTDNDALTTDSNTVTMTGDQIVTVSVEFERRPDMPVADRFSQFVLGIIIAISVWRKQA
jgi:hypothetical protein